MDRDKDKDGDEDKECCTAHLDPDVLAALLVPDHASLFPPLLAAVLVSEVQHGTAGAAIVTNVSVGQKQSFRVEICHSRNPSVRIC